MNEDIETRKLAEKLHQLFCVYNHSDICSWCFEEEDKKRMWTHTAHNLWYNKARLVLEYIRTEDEYKRKAFEEDCLFDD